MSTFSLRAVACVTVYLAIACSDDDTDKRFVPEGGAGAKDAAADGDANANTGPTGREGGASLFGDRAADTTVHTPGVKSRVEIARDEFGVTHVYAETIADAAFGQGYIHAKDRFFQIDLFRHLVEGRLSEYFGDVTFNTDVSNRSNMMTTGGRPVYEVMAEQAGAADRSVLEAYAAGVNLYVAELKAGKQKRPAGYDNALLARFDESLIPDWTPADTLAIGRLQEQNLSDSTASDIARGKAKDALPADLYADLGRYAPPDPIAILPDFYSSPFYGKTSGCKEVAKCGAGAGGGTAKTRALYRGIDFAKVLKAVRIADPFGMDRMPEGVEGSNNWVVSGAHTDTGNAFVLNDPHLRFYNPPLFYHSQMDTRYYGGDGDDKSSIMGISFPGIPGVLIGHNERVAWGATTVGWDVSDVYVETLNTAGDATLFNEAYVPLKKVDVTIKVIGDAGTEDRTQTYEIVPHHGVIIPDSKANGKAMTRKWTGHDPVSGVTALLERITAKNIDDFMSSMSKFAAGAQNWNGADVDGNTGYMPGAVIPVRASVTGDCDPTVPMDGTGPCEWTGRIPANEVPRVKNRENGFVVTANNDVTGTLADNDPLNDPQYLHSGNADGFRARRITDRVEELIQAGKVTKSQMVALQADTTSLEAKRLVPFVLAARDALPALVKSLDLGAALSRLEAWDFTNPSGMEADFRKSPPTADEIETSIAACIFNVFRAQFFQAAFGDEKTKYGASFSSETAALYLLEHPKESKTGYTLFDDPATPAVETQHDVILNALSKAVLFLTDKLGDDPGGWRWGALHQVEVQDLFGEFGLSFRTLGPFPRGGANSTVDVGGTGDALDNFHFFAGPQMRFVAEVGKSGIVAASSLPGGQIDDPDSPHYKDLLPLWLRNETFPYYFQPDDVASHTEELIVLLPGGT